MEGKTGSFAPLGTFSTYIMNIQEVLIRIHKCALTDKICTCCPMNKLYMERVQKR